MCTKLCFISSKSFVFIPKNQGIAFNVQTVVSKRCCMSILLLHYNCLQICWPESVLKTHNLRNRPCHNRRNGSGSTYQLFNSVHMWLDKDSSYKEPVVGSQARRRDVQCHIQIWDRLTGQWWFLVSFFMGHIYRLKSVYWKIALCHDWSEIHIAFKLGCDKFGRNGKTNLHIKIIVYKNFF